MHKIPISECTHSYVYRCTNLRWRRLCNSTQAKWHCTLRMNLAKGLIKLFLPDHTNIDHFFCPQTVRTKFPNRQHFPNGQCYAELGNTTFWNSSEFSNLNGFCFVVSLFVLWECFPLHHLSFISFKSFDRVKWNLTVWLVFEFKIQIQRFL